MKKIILVFGLVLPAVYGMSQDMMRLDVQILAQATGFTHATGSNDRGTLHAAPEVQVNYNINRFFSAGIVYSRSVASWNDIYINEELGGFSEDQVNSNFQSFGIIAKASTNRLRRLRFYLLGYATMTEIKDEYTLPYLEGGNFSISRSGLCYGAGFGLSVRVTRGFTLNLFEAKAGYCPDLSYVDENRPYYSSSLGLGFNLLFLREK